MQEEENSDDDSVQVLLTILPPSPPKKRKLEVAARRTPITTPNLRTPASTKASMSEVPPLSTTTTSTNKKGEVERPLTCLASDEKDDDARLPATAPITPSPPLAASFARPQFSSRSSAYLQSLAEICHAIMWDVRWRVGGSRQERLLKWERGNDLSAVLALAKRYRPPEIPKDRSSKKDCHCFLCKDSHASDGGDCNRQIRCDTGESCPTTSLAEDENSEMGTEEEDRDRALNLYARLYSRKGPWFRIDDIFKYYTPKRTSENASSPAMSASSPPNDNTKDRISPSKFFRPKSAKKTSNTTPSPSENRYIDESFVEEQLQAVSRVLQDVNHLHSMGLLRFFENEEECGKTIGKVQAHGLLKQEEQRAILSRLGGSKKSQAKHDALDENYIWKQMSQQQSIRALGKPHAKGANNDVVLLPVGKHVDHALINSWANTLILRASRVDYIPQGVFKKAIVPSQQEVRRLITTYLRPASNQSVSLTCLRLREAPLMSLQRCCRLYLCATSGPGDMRGDTGTNAWKALPGEVPTEGTRQKMFPSQAVSPPSTPNWHQTVYPGRDFRFKLISCSFQRAHEPLLVDCDEVKSIPEQDLERIQVFDSIPAFEVWEQAVVIRSIVDYLIETNDLTLYNERKEAREQLSEEYDNNGESADDANFTRQAIQESPMDFLGVLTQAGRRKIIGKFATMISPNSLALEEDLHREIEGDVAEFLRSEGACRNDYERILSIIAVIATYVLGARNQSAKLCHIHRATQRPWLRHLWWEGCLVYLLWDIVPILERRGFYRIATCALEILLFGKVLPRNVASPLLPQTLVTDHNVFLAQAYLSRRARGKAFDRLVIDYLHMLRREEKSSNAPISGKKTKRKRKGEEEDPKASTPNILVAQLSIDLLRATAPDGQISFSAARTLARRLKQPLSATLADLEVYEATELGHRFENAEPDFNQDVKEARKTAAKKYEDWTPKTDFAIANAMLAGDKSNAVGGRCTYVGFEDQDDIPTSTKHKFAAALNVEELAMEYYRTGRLPEQHTFESSTALRGGWVGWHDEGGKLRALFRILTSGSVLGSDWGCHGMGTGVLNSIEKATIHLTPYQGAPFDLHVGAEQCSSSNQSRSGFYHRRRELIAQFLGKLSKMTREEVSESVYQSIQARYNYAHDLQLSDPNLARDLQDARTLCAVAAGFGGPMLAAACRCLFFDYRHYSGGLPDLTLFRAIYEQDDKHPDETLVDLGGWIGEAFSPEHQDALESKRAARIFEDQDEEFLGCSKVGDSGRRNTRGGRQGRSMIREMNASKESTDITMPERVQFSHQGRHIRVECMLVEVKSQNDRLDSRQEDWLNVLDQYGNVRVCKFGAKKKKGPVTAKAAPN